MTGTSVSPVSASTPRLREPRSYDGIADDDGLSDGYDLGETADSMDVLDLGEGRPGGVLGDWATEGAVVQKDRNALCVLQRTGESLRP